MSAVADKVFGGIAEEASTRNQDIVKASGDDTMITSKQTLRSCRPILVLVRRMAPKFLGCARFFALSPAAWVLSRHCQLSGNGNDCRLSALAAGRCLLNDGHDRGVSWRLMSLGKISCFNIHPP